MLHHSIPDTAAHDGRQVLRDLHRHLKCDWDGHLCLVQVGNVVHERALMPDVHESQPRRTPQRHNDRMGQPVQAGSTVGHTGAGAEQQHRNARRRDLNDTLFIRYGDGTVLTAQRAVFQVQKGHPVPDLRQRLQIRADHARHIIHGCFLRAGWSSGQGRRLCRGQCPDTASPGTLPGRSPAGCPHRSPPAM